MKPKNSVKLDNSFMQENFIDHAKTEFCFIRSAKANVALTQPQAYLAAISSAEQEKKAGT